MVINACDVPTPLLPSTLPSPDRGLLRMSDPFVLRWKVDRPFIEAGKSEDVYTLLRIEPNTAAPASSASANLPVHIVILVDVSASMDFLVRHDPNAQNLDQGVSEGRR